jgi:hypothetical protein
MYIDSPHSLRTLVRPTPIFGLLIVPKNSRHFQLELLKVLGCHQASGTPNVTYSKFLIF